MRIQQASIDQLTVLEEKLHAAARELSADSDGGMAAKMQKGLIQLQRFVSANIEVDTSRTKQSVFMQTGRRGNRVWGMLGTNVKYSPWVRDAGHQMQFFEYAARREGPRVLEQLGREFALAVKTRIEE